MNISTSESSEDVSTSESSDEQNYQETNINLEGYVLNNYGFLKILGKGSYATVWLAYNFSVNNYVAIKVQHPDDYQEGKEELNFLRHIKSYNCLYINNLLDSFTQKIHNKKYIFMVFMLMSCNLDDIIRNMGWSDGFSENTVKIITKQILLGLNFLHNKIKALHGDIKPDNILISGINPKVHQCIKIYNKENFVEKYKIKKNEYISSKGIDINNKKKIKKILKSKVKQKIKQKIHKKIIQIINNTDNYEPISPKDILENILKKPHIKITDFGDFCKDDEKYDEEYGTRYYRPPEGILIGETSIKIDIWALGCTIWELLTGHILFNPDKDKEYSRDWYHLHLIHSLCGPFSKKYLKSTKRWKTFFNKKGQLNNYNDKKKESWESLINKYNISNDASEFIKQCIKIKPKERPTIEELLKHKWLN